MKSIVFAMLLVLSGYAQAADDFLCSQLLKKPVEDTTTKELRAVFGVADGLKDQINMKRDGLSPKSEDYAMYSKWHLVCVKLQITVAEELKKRGAKL